MTAPLADDHKITLTGRLKGDILPKATCTCGWESESSDEMMKLGTAAFNHRDETGHGLRQHTFGMSD